MGQLVVVVVGFAVGGALIALYFLPSIVASRRHNPKYERILIFNFLLGWTLIGWVLALAWARRESQPPFANVSDPVSAVDRSKVDRKIVDLLETDESFITASIFSPKSLLASGLSGNVGPQIRLCLTDRRVLMLSVKSKGEELLRSIPLSEIVAAKNTSRQGFGSPTLVFRTRDGTTTRLESGPYRLKKAETLASMLEAMVSNTDV